MAEEKIVYNLEVKTKDSEKSLSSLNTELKDVNDRLSNMSKQQIKNSKDGKELVARQKELKKAVEEHGVASGKASKQSGGFFGSIMGGIKSAYKSFIANPLGLLILGIVGALKGLYDAFNRSEKGQAILAKGMGALKGVVQVVSNLFDKLAEIIIGAFENPKQAIAGLWESIKTNIMNRFQGFVNQWSALGKIIQGVFYLDWDKAKEGVADYGDALVMMTTGFKREDIVNVIKEIGEEIVDVTNKSISLSEQELELRRRQIESITTLAQLETDIAKQRQIANDKTKTTEERLAAIAEAERLINEQNNLKIGLKQTELNLAKSINALGNNTIEDTEKEKLLQAELITLEKEKADAIKAISGVKAATLDEEINNQLKGFEITQKAEKDALDQSLINKEISYGEYIKRKEKMDGESLKNEIEHLNKILEEGELTEKKRIEIEQRIAKATTDYNKQTIDEISNSFTYKEELLENDYKLQKELAEAQISDAEALAKKKAEIDLEYHKKKLDLYIKQAEADGILTEEEKANIKKLTAEKDAAYANTLERNKFTFENAMETANQIMSVWSQVNDVLNTASERRIEKSQTEYDEDVAGAQAASDEKLAIMLEGIESEAVRDQIKQEQTAILNTELFNLELEKNKKIEEEKKKQFKRNKAFQLADALINTAGAVVKALNTQPFLPLGPIMAATAAASGAIQIGTIAAQKYAGGGILRGPLHSNGGINLGFGEVEGGEFIVNRAATAKYSPIISKINDAGNSNGDRNAVQDIIDYDRLGEAVRTNIKANVVAHEVTEQQEKDDKLKNSVYF